MSGLGKGLIISGLVHGLVLVIVCALPFDREARQETVSADFALLESFDMRASAPGTGIGSVRGPTVGHRKSLEKSAPFPSPRSRVGTTQERPSADMDESLPDTPSQAPVAADRQSSSNEGVPVAGSAGIDIAGGDGSTPSGKPMLASLGSGGGAAQEKGVGDGGYVSALRRIRDEVMRNVTYPERARRMGWEGKVIISFVLHEDGTVHDTRILQSSGVTVLDEAAKEALRKSVIDSQIARRVQVVLPIEYRLR